MLATVLRRFAALAVACFVLQLTTAVASPTPFDRLDVQARDVLADLTPRSYDERGLVARATPAAPHFVVYGDKYAPGTTGPPDASTIKGFNVLYVPSSISINFSICCTG